MYFADGLGGYSVRGDQPSHQHHPPDPAQLRNTLTDHIAGFGAFQTPQVEAAFRTLPWHVFLPGTSLEDVYAPQVVVTKRAGDGTAISSASSPHVVATMLEQIDVQPGHSILEIGASTGINAALLAELTGTAGHVTSIEIDADVAEAARSGIAAAGYLDRVTAPLSVNEAAAQPYDPVIQCDAAELA